MQLGATNNFYRVQTWSLESLINGHDTRMNFIRGGISGDIINLATMLDSTGAGAGSAAIRDLHQTTSGKF